MSNRYASIELPCEKEALLFERRLSCRCHSSIPGAPSLSAFDLAQRRQQGSIGACPDVLCAAVGGVNRLAYVHRSVTRRGADGAKRAPRRVAGRGVRASPARRPGVRAGHARRDLRRLAMGRPIPQQLAELGDAFGSHVAAGAADGEGEAVARATERGRRARRAAGRSAYVAVPQLVVFI